METRLRQKAIQDGSHSTGLYDEKQIRMNNQIVGKPDGETDTHVIERKAIKHWKHAIGQVLVYAHCLRKKPRIILIEEVPTSPDYRGMISSICSNMNIDVEIILYSNAKKDSSVIEKDWRYLLKKEHLYGLVSSDAPKSLNKTQLCSLCKDKTLDDLRKDHLYHIAGKINIKHRSSMKRDQLLSLLKVKFPEGTSITPPLQRGNTAIALNLVDSRVTTPAVQSPDSYASLKVEQLRELIKSKGINIPSRYIKKEDLISIARDPSTLSSILTKI